MTLSNKRQLFVNEYLRDFNATQAAIRAGYSPRSARSQGNRLLTKDDISTAIKAIIDEKAMTADEVLLRLADMGRGDLADLMELTTAGFTIQLMIQNDAGQWIPNPKTKLIKKIKQKVTTYLGKKEDSEDREIIETELELYDAQAALALLGKHHSLFIDRTDITSGGEKINVILKGKDD